MKKIAEYLKPDSKVSTLRNDLRAEIESMPKKDRFLQDSEDRKNDPAPFTQMLDAANNYADKIARSDYDDSMNFRSDNHDAAREKLKPFDFNINKYRAAVFDKAKKIFGAKEQQERNPSYEKSFLNGFQIGSMPDKSAFDNYTDLMKTKWQALGYNKADDDAITDWFFSSQYPLSSASRMPKSNIIDKM